VERATGDGGRGDDGRSPSDAASDRGGRDVARGASGARLSARRDVRGAVGSGARRLTGWAHSSAISELKFTPKEISSN
jgi:hypothetical protein